MKLFPESIFPNPKPEVDTTRLSFPLFRISKSVTNVLLWQTFSGLLIPVMLRFPSSVSSSSGSVTKM